MSELPSLDEFEALVQESGLGGCAVVLVGDGSGSDRRKPAGWACLAYDRKARTITATEGGCRQGGIGMVELLAYLWPFTQLTYRGVRGILSVGLITDAQYVVDTFDRAAQPDGNVPLWFTYRHLRQYGLAVKAIHRKRNTHPCQNYVDARSKAARALFVAGESLDDVATAVSLVDE